jgi:hypothetical protein
MIASSYPQNPRWLVAESRPVTFLKLQVYKVSQPLNATQRPPGSVGHEKHGRPRGERSRTPTIRVQSGSPTQRAGISKALIEVAGHSFLWHQLRLLKIRWSGSAQQPSAVRPETTAGCAQPPALILCPWASRDRQFQKNAWRSGLPKCNSRRWMLFGR